MRLPDFLIIGAMKSGTTSLADYLHQHPDIAVSDPKEPNYFADPGNWDKGVDWYASHFDSSARFVGEGSVRNTMVPEFTGAPQRIVGLVPDVRLIYLVRDPIDRMRSMFIHRADKYQEPAKTLSAAIDRNPAYVEISCYDRQLAPYLELFDESQILTITTDELEADPQRCLARAFRHIGTEPVTVDTGKRLEQGAAKKRLGLVGFRIAWAIKRSGVRRLLPPSLRRRVKRAFSTDFHVLTIAPDREAELREAISPHLSETRRLIAATGASVPEWLGPSP